MSETTKPRKKRIAPAREANSPKIIAALRATPAMAVTVLAKEIGWDQPSVTRTLQALAKEGVLTRLKGGAYCLPEDAPQPLPPFPEKLKQDERRQKIVEVIEAQRVPPTTGELGEAFSVEASAIAMDAQILVAAGVLQRDPARGSRRNLAIGPNAANGPVEARSRIGSAKHDEEPAAG